MKSYQIAVLDDYQDVALEMLTGQSSAIERTSLSSRTTSPIRTP